MATTSFWKQALASLPPSAQRRYAAAFETAERVEQRLDLAIAAWRGARSALAAELHRQRSAQWNAARAQ